MSEEEIIKKNKSLGQNSSLSKMLLMRSDRTCGKKTSLGEVTCHNLSSGGMEDFCVIPPSKKFPLPTPTLSDK